MVTQNILIMNHIRVGEFKRINKKQARTAFINGGTLYIQASNVSPESPIIPPYIVSNHNVDDNTTFDHVVNAFENYNCNSECGKYASFYVKTK